MSDHWPPKDTTIFTVRANERTEYPSGMVRDTEDGKPDYTLLPREMLTRWADHMGKGAELYGAHNWRKAHTTAELERYQRGAFRHLFQWLDGDTSEDHAAAVLFNVAAAEHVKAQARPKWTVAYRGDLGHVVRTCVDCKADLLPHELESHRCAVVKPPTGDVVTFDFEDADHDAMFTAPSQIRILEDDPYGSALTAGEVVRVTRRHSSPNRMFYFGVIDQDGNEWWLHTSGEGTTWERIPA